MVYQPQQKYLQQYLPIYSFFLDISVCQELALVVIFNDIHVFYSSSLKLMKFPYTKYYIYIHTLCLHYIHYIYTCIHLHAIIYTIYTMSTIKTIYTIYTSLCFAATISSVLAWPVFRRWWVARLGVAKFRSPIWIWSSGPQRMGPHLVANYPRIVSGLSHPGDFNGISGGNVHL